LISLKKGIEQSNEFSHGSDEGDLGSFAVVAEAAIEGLEAGFVANRGKGCHVNCTTDTGTAAGDVPLTAMSAAVMIDRGDPDQGCSLLRADHAKLRQFGQDDGRGEIGDTWNADEDIAAVREFLIGIDSKRDRGIDGEKLAFEGGKALLDKHRDDMIGVLAAILLGDHHIDELTAPGDQSSKRLPSRDQCRDGPRFKYKAEGGDAVSIDGIGLGKLAPGSCKVAHLARIDDRNGDFRRLQRAHQAELVTTRRLGHDERGRMSTHLPDEGSDTFSQIGITARLGRVGSRNIEIPLRDIDSHDVFGHDLLLLAMRAQSPSNRSSEQIAAEELAEERARSPRMTRSTAASGPVGRGQPRRLYTVSHIQG
jgi:hypothetical protein